MQTPAITLNRKQRRDLAKAQSRKPSRQHTAPLFNPIVLLGDFRPYEPYEIAHDFLKIRAAYERLRDGGADKEDFRRVAVAMNLAKVRALEIDMSLADEFEKAQDAMIACAQHAHRIGIYSFDGPGLLAMEWAIDAHETVVSASSHRQMQMAMEVVRDAVDRRTALGQQVAQLLA